MIEVIEKTASPGRTPIVFVHGASSSADVWDGNFLDFFAERGYRAIALSLRGHGASTLTQPLRRVSIANYVEDLTAVVSEIAPAPVLIGHSTGCWVVLNYIAQQYVPAAVLIAPGTPQGLRRWAFRAFLRHPWLMLRSNTLGNPVDLFHTPGLAREILFAPSCPDSVVEAFVSRLQPESPRAARDTVKPLPSPSAISAPMLVVGAAQDASRVEEDAAAVAARYGAQLEIIMGVGHAMMLEPRWTTAAERIASWLRGQGIS